MAERYVVLGLARPRSAWSRDVGQWATAAALPIEYVRCVSADEVHARLASGRRFSALLADGQVSGVDRDLIASARQRDCSVLIVDDPRVPRDWTALGASGVLDPPFGRDDLRAALGEHASLIDDAAAAPRPQHPQASTGWKGRLISVLGGGGTGSTTVAIAIAQGLADDARHGGKVVLADLCLDADLAVLHDAREIIPGLPELVEAHRLGEPAAAEVESLTFALDHRSYRLLLGLRKHRDWTALRPNAVRAAIDGLRRTFRVVVADIDHDLEGEAECGSIDVEERNLLARTATRQADVVVVVGGPGLTGLNRLVRLLDRVIRSGVEPERVVTIINRAPRHARARAETTQAIASLIQTTGAPARLASPIFVPERRHVDELHRDVRRFPAPLTSALVGAVDAVLARWVDEAPRHDPTEPTPIAVGSLGAWTDHGEH